MELESYQAEVPYGIGLAFRGIYEHLGNRILFRIAEGPDAVNVCVGIIVDDETGKIVVASGIGIVDAHELELVESDPDVASQGVVRIIEERDPVLARRQRLLGARVQPVEPPDHIAVGVIAIPPDAHLYGFSLIIGRERIASGRRRGPDGVNIAGDEHFYLRQPVVNSHEVGSRRRKVEFTLIVDGRNIEAVLLGVGAVRAEYEEALGGSRLEPGGTGIVGVEENVEKERFDVFGIRQPAVELLLRHRGDAVALHDSVPVVSDPVDAILVKYLAARRGRD